MTLKAKIKRRIWNDVISAAFWGGIAGVTAFRGGWWLVLTVLAVLVVIFMAWDARRMRRILRDPLFFLLAIKHDLGGGS